MKLVFGNPNIFNSFHFHIKPDAAILQVVNIYRFFGFPAVYYQRKRIFEELAHFTEIRLGPNLQPWTIFFNFYKIRSVVLNLTHNGINSQKYSNTSFFYWFFKCLYFIIHIIYPHSLIALLMYVKSLFLYSE